jgi:hypothetical protein
LLDSSTRHREKELAHINAWRLLQGSLSKSPNATQLRVFLLPAQRAMMNAPLMARPGRDMHVWQRRLLHKIFTHSSQDDSQHSHGILFPNVRNMVLPSSYGSSDLVQQRCVGENEGLFGWLQGAE